MVYYISTMNNFIILVFAIIAEVIATSALKASDGFSKIVPSAIVIVGYGVAFYFLSLALRTIPVGVAYAIWSGAGILLITLIGWLVFKQALDVPAIVGISFIVVGVAVLNIFSKASPH